MLWVRMARARWARADVCSGGSRKPWGCMKLLGEEPKLNIHGLEGGELDLLI